MKDNREVGMREDDKNYYDDERLPNSAQPEPKMGAGDYNFAKKTELDAMDTAGVVGKAYMDGDNMGQEGNLRPSLNANVDVHNSDTDLNITASNENLSAKYKYPRASMEKVEKDPTAKAGSTE